jgi:hypothetical protein
MGPTPPGGAGAPLPGVPPGLPAGIPPPPPVAPPPPGPAPGGASALLQGMLTDLPANLGTGWQLVDLAIRILRSAKRSTDFQRTPNVVAVLESTTDTLNTLLSNKTSGIGKAPVAKASNGGGGSPVSTDADAQPAQSGSSDADTSET